MASPEPGSDQGVRAASDWNILTQPEKRARVLAVAGELFAREGVEFPMPKLAKAAGIGVGTIYRQLGTKDDVLAELVVQRLEFFHAMYEEAAGSDDPISALRGVVNRTVQDRVAKISFDLALENDHVREVRARAAAALQRLIDEAKATGGLRQDADVMDLRMMFRVAREAERIYPGGGKRIAALVVDGLTAS